jgi:hypothetical protein
VSGLTAGEREALREALDHWLAEVHDDGGDDVVHAAVEGVLTARLAAVEALADEWGSGLYEPSPTTYGDCARDLRAALTAAGADDGGGGRGEGS